MASMGGRAARVVVSQPSDVMRMWWGQPTKSGVSWPSLSLSEYTCINATDVNCFEK